MFKKIEELHDHKTNEGFYPLTHVQAVIDNDEIDLETKLNQINNDISTKVTDYSKQYLTTVARENGTISFVISSGINTNLLTSMSYSTDRGKTWITTNNTDNKEENVQIDVNVSEGDKVMWKGIGLELGDDDNNASGFVTNISIDVEGNIMSLLYGDNFIGQTSLADGNCNFLALFGDVINSGADVVNAENLILPAITLAYRCYNGMFMGCTSLIQAPTLPATTLTNSCYSSMFGGCTSLIKAPELPATTLADYCYRSMFSGCTSLTQAPALPATTLAERCYWEMFQGCTSLTQAPALPATTLANYCYSNMFYGCTSLTQAPALPATTLANYCYSNMFYGCTSLTQVPVLPATVLVTFCYNQMFFGCTALTKAPALPATTLANSCYNGMFHGCISLIQAPALSATTLVGSCYNSMFQGCTSLIQAPELPATTLAAWCYVNMFYDCTSLTQAPELPATTLAAYCYNAMFMHCTSLTQAPTLPATTLANSCYNGMFNGCPNLSSITCLATDISANNSTTNWLYGVASIGTFAKPASMTSWGNGISGIPNGWTTVDCIATTPTRYLTFRAETDNSSFGLKTIATGHKVYYSKDLQYWKLLNTEEDIEINDGEEVYVIGDSDGVTFSTTNNTTFRMSGAISVTGDITSILDYKTLTEKIAPYCYSYMFQDCTALIQAPTLPATTLAGACYYRMFYGCTSLTQAPTLPATTLANNCYFDMFNGCTALTQAPELPATTLANYCYGSMFGYCTSLTKAPILPATTLTDNCYGGMFWGCTLLTQAPELPATILKVSCYSSMFRGCTSLIQAPTLPATTLKAFCYYQMFYGCTALTHAPVLSATTLANDCYQMMFKDCTNLSSVICLATDISASMATTDWLSGVAATGTFITGDNPPAWSRNGNGIPSDWNAYTESGYEVVRHQDFDINISITPFISKQQKINNKSINQILIPIDSSKNNYSGDNLSDTTIITYISDNENYLVLELGNVIEENYVIIEANLIGQGFYSNANILYNNGVAQIYSALPLNSIKDNLEYLFISYYISDTSGCGCGCGTTPDSPDPTPVPDPTPASSE